MTRRTAAAIMATAVAISACVTVDSPLPASPPPSPSASASAEDSGPPFSCPARTASLTPPSNTLIGVTVAAEAGFDRITFTFGSPVAASGTPPGAIMQPADPPFVEGASGLPLPVEGDRFVVLTFRDMVIADENGQPSYAGPSEIRPGTPAVREVVLGEAFEGIVTWIVGMAAPGCLRTLGDTDGSTLSIEVRHP